MPPDPWLTLAEHEARHRPGFVVESGAWSDALPGTTPGPFGWTSRPVCESIRFITCFVRSVTSAAWERESPDAPFTVPRPLAAIPVAHDPGALPGLRQ